MEDSSSEKKKYVGFGPNEHTQGHSEFPKVLKRRIAKSRKWLDSDFNGLVFLMKVEYLF